MSERTCNRSSDLNLQNTTSNIRLPSPAVILHRSSSTTSTKRHLTCLRRLVKDLVAEFYNATQKWNDLVIEGAPVIKQMRTFKENNPRNITAALEELTNNLCELVKEMKQVLTNLSGLTDQMFNVVRLQNGNDAGRPLFMSLNVDRFSQVFREILEAYKAEFKVKQSVSRSIAFSKDKDETTFLAALWVYQTKIPRCINLKMEVLLMETGQRKFS